MRSRPSNRRGCACFAKSQSNRFQQFETNYLQTTFHGQEGNSSDRIDKVLIISEKNQSFPTGCRQSTVNNLSRTRAKSSDRIDKDLLFLVIPDEKAMALAHGFEPSQL